MKAPLIMMVAYLVFLSGCAVGPRVHFVTKGSVRSIALSGLRDEIAVVNTAGDLSVGPCSSSNALQNVTTDVPVLSVSYTSDGELAALFMRDVRAESGADGRDIGVGVLELRPGTTSSAIVWLGTVGGLGPAPDELYAGVGCCWSAGKSGVVVALRDGRLAIVPDCTAPRVHYLTTGLVHDLRTVLVDASSNCGAIAAAEGRQVVAFVTERAGQYRKTLEVEADDQVTWLGLSSDAALLAYSTVRGSTVVLRAADGERVCTISGPALRRRGLARKGGWCSTSRELVIVRGGTLELWDLGGPAPRGKAIACVDPGTQILGVSARTRCVILAHFSQFGGTALTRVWLDTGARVRVGAPGGFVQAYAQSEDMARFATGNHADLFGEGTCVNVWDAGAEGRAQVKAERAQNVDGPENR